MGITSCLCPHSSSLVHKPQPTAPQLSLPISPAISRQPAPRMEGILQTGSVPAPHAQPLAATLFSQFGTSTPTQMPGLTRSVCPPLDQRLTAAVPQHCPLHSSHSTAPPNCSPAAAPTHSHYGITACRSPATGKSPSAAHPSPTPWLDSRWPHKGLSLWLCTHRDTPFPGLGFPLCM